jgi:ribosomal protein L24
MTTTAPDSGDGGDDHERGYDAPWRTRRKKRASRRSSAMQLNCSAGSARKTEVDMSCFETAVGLKQYVSPESLLYVDRLAARAGITRQRGIKAAEIVDALVALGKQQQQKKKQIAAATAVTLSAGSLDEDTVAPSLCIRYKTENDVLAAKISIVSAEIMSIEGQLQAALQEERDLQAREKELKSLVDEWNARVRTEGTQQELREKVLESEIEDHTREAGAAKEQKGEAQAELMSLQEALASAKRHVAELEAKLADLSKKIVEVKKSADKATVDGVEARKELEKQLEMLRRKNEDLRHEIERANIEVERKMDRHTLAEQHLAKVRADISGLAKQVWKQQASADRAGKPAQIASAPTGVISLVFCDVQDSQALWEELPDCMTLAQYTSNRIVRERIVRNGGYEVKSDGESFMIAFGSARTAVAFCCEV